VNVTTHPDAGTQLASRTSWSSPVHPDYGGACVQSIVPALLGPSNRDLPDWIPAPLRGAAQVVLLVIDGLGWEQLTLRQGLAPTLTSMSGGPITTVVPSTTSTALTSIVTGLTPGEHGVVGYRMQVGGEVLNVLRWTTPRGDARARIRPAEIQPHPAFLGGSVAVVGKSDVQGSAFTEAHMRGVRHHGWRLASSLPVELRALLQRGETFVYSYYDGLDRVAHEYGFGPHYDAELSMIDRIVADVLDILPPGAVLCITADHGQVHVGPHQIKPAPDVLARTKSQSGEGRFRWLHAHAGGAADLRAAAEAAHGAMAWVWTKEQLIDEGWFGRSVSSNVARRLGDVALIARADVSFDDSADTGPYHLICRHGSLTAAEMLVPFVAGSR
jgi:predicted AlkP superfamily pyrophosphatase or phosphodiesterase